MSDLGVPGMIAVVADGSAPPSDPPALPAHGAWTDHEGVFLHSWGMPRTAPTEHSPLLLTSVNLSEEGPVPEHRLAGWLRDGDLARLGRMQPPFAALGLTPTGYRLATDSLGFRPIHLARFDGWSAVSTSARLLAALGGSPLDEDSVLLSSQLGWLVSDHTPFKGISMLPPGAAVHLARNHFRVEPSPHQAPSPGTMGLAEAVPRAANRLRTLLEQYLDAGNEPVLQLTGGQDSRIVLSAIPKAMRGSIPALTLDVPGTKDATVAADIAGRFGMRHFVHRMTGWEDVRASEWFERAVDIATAHDCMADPITRAVTWWAEESMPQGPRLSGIGGEVARGFFYSGIVRPRPVTPARSATLARWRLLANDSVPVHVLAPGLATRAIETSIDMIHQALVAAGTEWFSATDELYLLRIRRWAGLGESTVGHLRSIVNPMLDHQFLEVAHALSPRAKQRGHFLGRLQVELDEDLARLPLDDRPPPSTFASEGIATLLALEAHQVRKLASKAKQRLFRGRRPLPGAAVVARGVAAHVRAHPSELDGARALGILNEQWVESVLGGTESPSPPAMALLVNLVAAARGVG